VEGAGLAFIVYSEAIQNMPLPQLWSVLYFFMLLLLGMGSMLGNITAIITPLRDFKVVSRNLSIEALSGKALPRGRSSRVVEREQKLCIVKHPGPRCAAGRRSSSPSTQ